MSEQTLTNIKNLVLKNFVLFEDPKSVNDFHEQMQLSFQLFKLKRFAQTILDIVNEIELGNALIWKNPEKLGNYNLEGELENGAGAGRGV